ncbi:MAG: NTP transferase domain-containing protein [Methyloligellaceae bacterium]
MKFRKCPLSEAIGGLLTHSYSYVDRKFRKGYEVTSDDLEIFSQAGVSDLYVAHLEAGDIGENKAATVVAEHFADDQCDIRDAFTGRVNVYARSPGLVIINSDLVHRMNSIDPAITVATVKPWLPVETGQILATIKIIPFAVAAKSVEKVVELGTSGGPAIRVQAFGSFNAGLISSQVQGTQQKLIDKGYRAIDERLRRFGSSLTAHEVCDHREEDITKLILRYRDRGHSPIFILGAAAISDARDVVPQALVDAGGEIDHVGMPVDPGNLMMLGRLGDSPVVGVPSCARSPAENGFDLVLHRLLAGLEVKPSDIAAMGVGGLLADTPLRTQARTRRAGNRKQEKRSPAITAVVLAAGQSTRMGRENKLLAEIAGKKVLQRVVDALVGAGITNIVVVVGHEASVVKASLASYAVKWVENPDYAQGLSTSLKKGVLEVSPESEGILVCLGDMPILTASHITKLGDAFVEAGPDAIIVPKFNGKQGNPILWSRTYRDELLSLSGDIGAKSLIQRHEEQVVDIDFIDEAVVTDVDTPGMLEEVREKLVSKP